MNQAPEPRAPLGIVGGGRLARHLRHYGGLLGLDVRSWTRRDAGSPLEALAGCGTVAVLVRDDAIVPFIDTWPALGDGRHLVHCAGGLVTPLAHGAHPLMTFGGRLYDRDVYERVPFVLDNGGVPFHVLFPGFPNPSFAIAASDRPYYHALCAMAGNFSTILWMKLFDEFDRRLGIPPSAAHPYLEQVTANLHVDAARALTGPLSRGDTATIASHLAALDDDPFKTIYQAFREAYAHRT